MSTVPGTSGVNFEKPIAESWLVTSARNLTCSKTVLTAGAGLAAVVGVVAIAVLEALVCQAQSQVGSRPTPVFEVASIKRSGQGEDVIGAFVYPGGRLVVTNYTLKMLIHEAYGVSDFQILGGPKWAGEQRYSIVAKPPSDSQSSQISPTNPKLGPPAEERLMLRALLAERFRLIIHEETREGRVFDLLLGSEGPRLTHAKDKDALPGVGYGRTGTEPPDFMQGRYASMAVFAERLSRALGHLVLDRTGLKGAFDFRIEYAQDLSESAEGPSLFRAVQQLGLRLLPTKGPVLHLVIDRVEKPSEN